MARSPDAPSGGSFTAQAALRWMGAHGDRLRGLIAEEGREHPVRLPADDGCIRANLRLLAEALADVAAPPLAQRLAGFAEGLDAWFDQEHREMEAHLARAEGAIALEEHLQFGTRPGHDPSLDAALERRMRLAGWVRMFAFGLEAHLGPSADGLAQAMLAWTGERQRELARLVLTLDAHARAGYAAAHPERPATPEVLDEIGQLAIVRAHVRQAAEALEAALTVRA